MTMKKENRWEHKRKADEYKIKFQKGTEIINSDDEKGKARREKAVSIKCKF